MDDTLNVGPIAGRIGEPARARMLLQRMGGGARTAIELAHAADVTKQTASSHVAKLPAAHRVVVERSGPYGNFRLADHEVAGALEQLAILGNRVPPGPNPGPTDPA